MQPERERHLLLLAATDPAAFSELYEYYFPRMYGYVIYRVNDQHDAEDLVADIFLRALQGLERFDYRGEGAFAAWLFRIANNAVISLYRQRSREATTPLSDEGLVTQQKEPDTRLMHQEEAARLHQLVNSLSKQRREVISLKFFGGLRNQEIAEILGINERTVASHLCRGIEDLRAKYQGGGSSEGGDYG